MKKSLSIFSAAAFSLAVNAAKKPNFIIIFTDDQGYQDLGCYGSKNIKTPRIDQMAKEGIRFTDFYAQTVCGPSRASLMTGCYPMRVGRDDNGKQAHPKMSLNEVTIAEILKPLGYKTCMIGKWDLAGHSQTKYSPALLPSKQGFDHTFTTPQSNDLYVNLIRNGKMVEKKADLSQLTKRYTNEAIKFIDQSGDKPFFVYLAHTMPHVELAVSDEFKGKSEGGLYGDVIEELDHNVGRILDHLKKKQVDDNTYVIFTSDNGPWYLGHSEPHFKRIGKDAAEHGGSALPLRGAKTATWEGGLRVPCIMRAPGKIPAGIETNAVAATIDVLPTIAKIAGGEVPSDRVIDGIDISEIIHGKEKHVDRAYFYYQHDGLQAVRKGKWKLHIPAEGSVLKAWQNYSKPEDRVRFQKPALFDLSTDIGEKNDIASANPEVVKQMMTLIKWAKKDIGHLKNRGENARPLKEGSSAGKSTKKIKKNKKMKSK